MKLEKLKKEIIKRKNLSQSDERRLYKIREKFRNVENETEIEFTKILNKNAYEKVSNIEILSNVKMKTEEEITNDENNDKLKIIGITGSKGKSTTANVISQYLKAKGYKVVLYSSVKVDSPASYVCPYEVCEMPLKDEDMLLDIIDETIAYDADYLIMEINEDSIAKGLTNDIPFDVRVLTNIITTHNKEIYSEVEYFNIKKSFFENIPDDADCINVLGLTGNLQREQFNSLLKTNKHQKVTFGSKYICETRNANYTNLDYLMYPKDGCSLNTIDGLKFSVRCLDRLYDIESNLLLPHNALNLTCAIAVLDSLKEFDHQLFLECIKNITIPGREEVVKWNNRTIVIGMDLIPALEEFKTLKDKNQINNLIVLLGSRGNGFISWLDRYKYDVTPNASSNRRNYAINYVKEYANYVILTSNDNAATNPTEIALEMQKYLNNQIPSIIEIDRKKAIQKAINESAPNDLIYIAGRGNKRVFCSSETNIELFSDMEIVLKTLKDESN